MKLYLLNSVIQRDKAFLCNLILLLQNKSPILFFQDLNFMIKIAKFQILDIEPWKNLIIFDPNFLPLILIVLILIVLKVEYRWLF